ncbi:hypothetical protein SAMN05216269_10386 [Flavobacterium xinjiangense]|uniref:Uncharacterized protein n=1 Tax=Flavobacterium xinjiangense TaxID=178356 RepID=A0A1M7GW35_9FLAO|nr:hypothetical protein SAMN05216269_10386 [Flavobacterium xinjiangense]
MKIRTFCSIQLQDMNATQNFVRYFQRLNGITKLDLGFSSIFFQKYGRHHLRIQFFAGTNFLLIPVSFLLLEFFFLRIKITNKNNYINLFYR